MSESAKTRERPWRGVWIGLDWQVDCWPIGENRIAFRKDVRIPFAPRRAPVRICASVNYVLWVNGKFAAYGPARAFPARAMYDAFDLVPYLRRGVNRLAILVDGPTGATGYRIAARPGLIVDGEIRSGRRAIPLFTDTTWLARRADWFQPTGLLSSLPTTFQEHVDGRKAPRGWPTSTADRSWQPAWYIAPAGTAPWLHLTPRSIPMLAENPASPPLVWRGAGAARPRDVRDNLLFVFNALRIEGHAVPRPNGGLDCRSRGVCPAKPAIRQQTSPPKEWITGRPGDVYTFDFGRTRLVRPGVELRAAQGELRLEFYYDQELKKRPTGMDSFGNPRAGFADSYRAPRGDSAWEALNPRGLRFATVRIAGRGRCRFRLRARTVDYPFPAAAARFASSEPFLDKAWRISAATLRSTATDVYSDCCSRENMLWAFDGCVSAKAAYFTFGETALWRRCLVLLGEAVQTDGDVFAMAPLADSFDRLYDQSMYWVVSCLDYWRCTGDATLLHETAPAIARFLAMLESHMTAEDLFVPPAHAWHWIDWAPLEKRPNSLAVNAFLGLTARSALQIGRAAGDAGLTAVARSIDRRLSRSLPRFFDPRAGAFRARLRPAIRLPHNPQPPDWPGIPRRAAAAYNLHGNALVCRAGYGTRDQRARAVEFMRGICRETPGARNTFGPGWTELILGPLCASGHHAAVRVCLERRYGPSIANGAPTWGEDFSGQFYNTAHGWGASINSLIAGHLVGLRPLAAGWGAIAFEPDPALGDFSYAFAAPRGEIEIGKDSGGLYASWPRGVGLRCRGRLRRGSGAREKVMSKE